MARPAQANVPCFSCQPAEAVGLLIDADAYYREFYRAASLAQRSILLSGWQFDSKVALLRGEDAESAAHPVTLLSFLNSLCEQKPDLVIKIMAWDFNLVFAAEREWMQKVAFHWMTHERLSFRFDSNHVSRGCHHQKFVVIDGQLSFVGGLDLCDHRWDTREHLREQPLRMSRGEPHQPFHDIQAVVQGSHVARSLTELFDCRWQRAGGSPLPRSLLEPLPAITNFAIVPSLPLAADCVYLSRTDPFGSPDGPENCVEIRELYLDAIERAESVIYLETQYFSSKAVCDAFLARMGNAARSKLEIVMVLNMRGETLKEQAAVGLAQAEIIGRLRDAAKAGGHQLGIYYTLPAGMPTNSGSERGTYIHSKLMIVDDVFLTVGSANLTNRSMDVDTELNLTVVTENSGSELATSIRNVRRSLLSEHAGGDIDANVRDLVAVCDAVADRETTASGPNRLQRHPSPTAQEKAWLLVMDPQSLPFDPDENDLETGPGFAMARSIEQTLRDVLGGEKTG